MNCILDGSSLVAEVFDELCVKQRVRESARGNHLLDVLGSYVSMKVISPEAQVDDAGCISDHHRAYTVIDAKSAPRLLAPFKRRCISHIYPRL
jgi:hypothetical protein